MNSNLRNAALIAAGIVGAGSAATAEEAKMNPVETALSATTISGYVSASAMFDLGGNNGAPLLPGRVFDLPGEVNQFNLDVVKLSIEKGLSEGDWSAGYKVDLLFGPDVHQLGVNSFNGANAGVGGADSDFGIKQAYVTLQSPVGNGLTAKIGVFDTIIGYEVFEHPNNPNYSRSYAYFIEPFQHTGLLLSYTVNDWLAFNAGLANAWNARVNAGGGITGAEEFGIQTYMGSMVITAGDGAGALKGSQFYAGIVHGLSGTGGALVDGAVDADQRTSLYAGLTLPLGIEGLGLGLAYDYRFSDTAASAETSEYATTAAAYLSYQFSKQLKGSVRAEYAKGTDGTWDGGWTLGLREEYLGLTGTLDILAWQNAIVRLEARWDNDLSGGSRFGSALDADDSGLIAGVNVMYKF